MRRSIAAATFAVLITVFAAEAIPTEAKVPQREWVLPTACQAPGGPPNTKPPTLFYDASGTGAYVEGNYLGFVCNYGFERTSPTGRFAGVAVTVDYCGGTVQSPKREEGNYNTYAGQFTVRQQRWVLHAGALVVIVLYTNNHNGADDFTTQEMTTGFENLVDLNAPQGSVGCYHASGSGGTWSITLSADAAQLTAGNQFVLTATANKNVSGSGFAIFIVNQTDGVVVYCQNVQICIYKDYRNDPGTRNYQAFVANLQGQDVQAESNIVNVNWAAWTGSVALVLQEKELDAGETAHLIATATPTINATSYMIRIERSDNGSGGNCLESPCTKTENYDAGVTYTYVAKVLKNDGTDLRATSVPLKVSWKATEQWHGQVFIGTANNIDTVQPGVAVVVEAYADPDLMNTDLVLQILEQGGAGASTACDPDVRCTIVVNSTIEASRTFRAVAVKREGGATAATSASDATVKWSNLGKPRACQDGWQVLETSGDAFVHIGDSVKVPIKPGMWICPKDSIETGPNGRVRGWYYERGDLNPSAGQKAEINVDPKTNVTLDFTPSGVHRERVNLPAGTVNVNIFGGGWPTGVDFHIVSPTTVTGVRGTRFSVTVEATTGATTVRSYEHEVFVAPTNPALAPVSIFGGDEVTVSADKKSAVTKFVGQLTNTRRLPALVRDGPN
jgi:hypothetical protein